MSIVASDPFDTLIYQQQLISTPLVEGGAGGADDLDVAQRSVVIGDVVPIVFGRRVGTVGGVLISPGATEARFENDTSNAVTASYHLVLSEGELDGIQVRDVFQRSCRVGSFTQTYSRRAGPWLPGNFIIDRGGSYTKPECPYYCGSGGTYTGMTTGSYVIEDVPDGDTRWDRQVHLFIRGGMHVIRLLDAVDGPSNNVADLALWLMRNTSRTPEALIDVPAFEIAAEFTDNTGLWFNGEIRESVNFEDWLADHGRYFLLTKSKRNGKIGLRPMLPVTVGNEIDTTPITPSWRFDEDSIIPGSFELSYIPLTDRKPFCALMMWRQQPDDDIGLIRTTEVRYAGQAVDGPFEQHDLSVFATGENHAVKVGANIVARRRYITHTLRIKVRPAAFNASLAQGDIVQVVMQRVASSAAAGEHRYLYEVDRIGKARDGAVSLDLIHFPVDELGRSLVALDVVAATGGGILLDTGKSGTSCDVNSDSDTTVPADDSLDPGDWTLPGDDAFDVILPDTDFGTGTDGDGVAGGGGYGDGGSEADEVAPDELDDQGGNNPDGISPGGAKVGDMLSWAGCGCTDSTIEWRRDGELVGTGPTYEITVEDMAHDLVGIGKCSGVNTCETDPVPVPFVPAEYGYWRFRATGSGGGGWSSTSSSAGYLNVVSGLSPGSGSWVIHSGRFTSSSLVGGNLAQLYMISLSNGTTLLDFYSYVGSATPDPANATNFASPGVWEFAFSNTDTGPDAWDAQWGGYDGLGGENDLP